MRSMTRVLMFGVVLALGAATAWGQGATPVPLSRVTVSADVAKRTMMKNVITADAARAIVDECVAFSKASGQTVSVFVLSPTGEVVDAHVMDGVLPIGVETGLLKAKTALYARSSSAAVAQRFNNVDGRLIRLDLGKETGLAYYFVGGGLPIVVEDQMIGAVGVGGGNADEMCAYTAMTKVLGPQPPLSTGDGRGGAPGGGREGAPGGGGAGRGRGNN
jgi:uncharacterized protein GlcG (DUF336 family)